MVMAAPLEVWEVTPMTLGHHLALAMKVLDIVEMRLLEGYDTSL